MTKIIEYSYLSTFELIKSISVQEDNNTLNYFLSNRKLLTINGKRLLLPVQLQKLRERRFSPYVVISNHEKHLEEKLDLTYDRTLQKFAILKNNSRDIEGPYCNNQYNELFKGLTGYKINNTDCSQIELELEAERLLKKMIIRHLKYSWLEVCRKSNRMYQRYRWVLPDGAIELMKPIGIDGRYFTKWLENYIENPDPKKKGEKFRVQKEINDWYGYYSEVDFEKIIPTRGIDIELTDEYPEDFSSLVANEKAEIINSLRPSIKVLGKDKVRNLVSAILESFVNNKLNDNHIAKEFGLSKATYSRFAGKDWKKNNDGEVPDLWKNIAHIITSNPIFNELAISLGIKTVIDSILEPTKTR